MVLTTEDIRRILIVFQECQKLLEDCCDEIQIVLKSAVSLAPTLKQLLHFDISKELYPNIRTYDESLGEITKDLPAVEFRAYGSDVLRRIQNLVKTMKEYWKDIRSSIFKSRARLRVLRKLLNGEFHASQDWNWDNVSQKVLDTMLPINNKIIICLNANKELMKIAERFLNDVIMF